MAAKPPCLPKQEESCTFSPPWAFPHLHPAELGYYEPLSFANHSPDLCLMSGH